MDNLIFCLNATVPIFAVILIGRLLRGRHFFAPQTLADIDRLSFKVLLPDSAVPRYRGRDASPSSSI